MNLSRSSTSAPLRVLLVEDSEDDAELVLRELQRSGLMGKHRRVESAEELVAALDDGVWDIILSDYSLPSFDGLRAHQIVQERGLDIPFIIVSGTVGEEVAVRAMRAGVHDYLLKDKLTRLPAAVEREVREAKNRRDAHRDRDELAIQARRYRSIFESASVGLWELDLSGARRWLDAHNIAGAAELSAHLASNPEALVDVARTVQILDANETTLALFGAPDKDVLRGSVERILEFGFEEAWKMTLTSLAERTKVAQTEVAASTFTGGQIRVLVSVNLPPHDEDLNNVVVAMFDVTDRWQLEQQMRASQRMEAVGRLAGGVAHDFNNVLTVIQSYAGFLRDQFHEQDPARKDIEVIEDAGKRAARLTSQLLAFSRRQVQQLEIISLNESIDAIGKMIGRLIGEDIDVRTTFHEALGLVKADSTQIEQIVMNLAVNARDAMPQGGKLTIETANIDLDETYGAARGVQVPPGRYVMLAISDTGSGIDPSVRPHIFEPFYTTKDKGKGTGLGLSTVYGIVRQSGGYIWVYSEPGQGTTFKIYFPRAEEETTTSRSRPAVPTVLGGSETILLVEDEDLVRDATGRILARQGYRVLEAGHGSDAILLAERQQEPIHLLLTDVVMPGMGGRRLAKRLASLRPTMKIVFMSGYTDDAIVHHGVLDEGNVFVQKPFSPESLLRAVRAALDADSVGSGR